MTSEGTQPQRDSSSFTVPNIIGMTWANARIELQPLIDGGVDVKTHKQTCNGQTYTPSDKDKVKETCPPPGSSIAAGAALDIGLDEAGGE